MSGRKSTHEIDISLSHGTQGSIETRHYCGNLSVKAFPRRAWAYHWSLQHYSGYSAGLMFAGGKWRSTPQASDLVNIHLARLGAQAVCTGRAKTTARKHFFAWRDLSTYPGRPTLSCSVAAASFSSALNPAHIACARRGSEVYDRCYQLDIQDKVV